LNAKARRAIARDKPGLFRELLAINEEQLDMHACFHQAEEFARNGKAKFFKILLSFLMHLDPDWATPAFYKSAIQSNDISVFRAIPDTVFSPYSPKDGLFNGESLFATVTAKCSLEIVIYLSSRLDHGCVSCGAECLSKENHIVPNAVLNPNTRVFDWLVTNGYPVSYSIVYCARDNNLDMALHVLTQSKEVNIRAGRTLALEHGKITALAMAAKKGYTAMVKFLMSRGANPLLKYKGNTAYSYAKAGNHTEVIEIFEAYGIKK
jgi:ankyrin repeat protein